MVSIGIPPQTGAKARRILVVDDHHDCAQSLALLLQLLGHEVEIASDGLAAVTAAESFRPDVILLDIKMPGFNGYDVCKNIRAQPWGKGVFIIALTGLAQERSRDQAQSAGFDSYLVKPFELTNLLQEIEAFRPEMNLCPPTDPASIDNRRCDLRHEVRYPVLLAGGDAITHNISESGVYFETDRQMDVGQRIHFAVMLPPESPDVVTRPYLWCEGRVVRIVSRETGQVGVGVALETRAKK
ncbi:MAG: response regulator [Azonexus sp.]